MKGLAFAIDRSGNQKIGDASTTYAAQSSCPASCRFRDGGGCYAEAGILGTTITRPLNQVAAVVAHQPVDVAQDEAAAIDELPRRRQPLRLHTVGDCPDEASARIVADAAYRFMRDGGGPVWTYTHAWREVPRDAWEIVSILASCETADDIREARARGYATSITVERFDSDRRYALDADPCISVVPCPAQTRDDVTCASCRLCMDDSALRDRDLTIGFALHGTALTMRQARLALRDPDNPHRRLSSRELIPMYRAEHPGATASEIAKHFGLTVASVREMELKLAAERILARPGTVERLERDR